MSFSLSKLVKFPQSTLEHISEDIYKHEPLEELILFGGILSDAKHIWHAKGPCLEIKHIATGKKVGAWTFGCILKDSNTKIVCVDEVKRPYGRLPLLAVGINCTISGGLLCIFDAFGSKVIRAVQIGQQITSLHVIDSGCNSLFNSDGPLKYFDGIIAVGCQGGSVLLVDICRQICDDALQNVDLSIVRDELCPCQLRVLTKNHLSKLQKYALKTVKEGQHLALHLNAVLNSTTEHFTLQGEKGEDRLHVNQTEVEVSALYYAQQLSSLCIGYNFGAFQIWHLPSLHLAYTSPVCEEHLSVTHFAIQEPADDPKAYCYMWVSYSNVFLYQNGLPYAVMYSLYFDKKKLTPGCGQVYEDFQHCSVRFQIELGPLSDSKRAAHVKGGYCVGLQSISKNPIIKDLHSLSLCLISWTLWIDQTETETCILLFDLNQWYKEQMPNEINWKNCSNYSISQALKGSLLDVKLDKKSISQFIGIQRLEEHFCPTSLSFDLWLLYENSIQKFNNQGLQETLLSQFDIAGPLSLVKPQDFYEQIASLGLTPLFNDVSVKVPISVESQRKLILDVVLEQKLISFLCRCATEWANGSFSSAGLSLEFFSNWAFQRASVVKNNCDNYCEPLFDYSGSLLDNNSVMLLSNCITQIKNICCVYNYLLTNLQHFIYDQLLLKSEYICLQNISMYFEIILWLVNVGLLPEYHPVLRPELSSTIGPYLVDELSEYYNEKRARLKQLTHETFAKRDSLLFIDNLINKCCGAHLLQQQWQADGGSGLYPPPSLQSMLRTYLVTGPDMVYKHLLVTYVLLDIAMTLDEEKYPETVALLCRFPHIFQLSQSNIKIIQGFWHLDHGNFEIGLENILDPCIQADDLQEWHHKVLMRSLLLQEQYTSALLYMQIKKPPITEEKDVLTVISLFVSRSLLDEAFYFEHQYRNCNEEMLLMHLFNECNKNGLLHGVLYRCLSTAEEQTFFKYLESTRNPSSEDLKVFYYLLRSRFIEAFDSHDVYKKRKPETQGLMGQRIATPSDSIVRMFKTLLPDVNRTLVDVIRKERGTLWKEVERPTPLSVFVHNSREKIQYKSTTIYAALAKAKQTFNDTLNVSHREIKTEETPFLRTPKSFRSISELHVPVIHSQTIEINESGEETLGPSPSKRLKLTPRVSAATVSPSKSIMNMSKSMLNTPIVKRKVSLDKSQTTNIYTPQSILKHRKTVIEGQDSALNLFETSRNVSLGLSPRKSLARTPIRTHVKFDDLRYSTSSSSGTSRIEISSKDVTVNNNSSEDTFYSPNTSVNENDVSSAMELDTEQDINLDGKNNETIIKDHIEPTVQVNILEDSVVEKADSPSASCVSSSLVQSPKSRKSYKRSIGENSPIRYSPRLTQKNIEDPNNTSTTSSSSTTESLKSTPIVTKVSARKSLSRAVLEYNTYLKAKSIWEDDNEKREIEDNNEKKHISEENSKNDSKANMPTYSDTAEVSQSVNESEGSPPKLDIGKVCDRKTVHGRKAISRSFTNSKKDAIPSEIYARSDSQSYNEKISYSGTVTHTSSTKVFEEVCDNDTSLSPTSVNQQTVDEIISKTKETGKETYEMKESYDETNKKLDVALEVSDTEQINIYEDLSSGSDDESSETSQSLNNSNNGDKTDSPGVFKHGSDEISGSSNDNDSSDSSDNKSDESDFEKGFEKKECSQNDVIEIGSSSEDDGKESQSDNSSNSEGKIFRNDHSNSNAEILPKDTDGDLNILYEKQEQSNSLESSSSGPTHNKDDQSDSDASQSSEKKLVTDYFNLSNSTEENSGDILEPDAGKGVIIKEVYDLENVEQESEFVVLAGSATSETIEITQENIEIYQVEMPIEIDEEIDTSGLTQSVIGVEIKEIYEENEPMEIDDFEVSVSVFERNCSESNIEAMLGVEGIRTETNIISHEKNQEIVNAISIPFQRPENEDEELIISCNKKNNDAVNELSDNADIVKQFKSGDSNQEKVQSPSTGFLFETSRTEVTKEKDNKLEIREELTVATFIVENLKEESKNDFKDNKQAKANNTESDSIHDLTQGKGVNLTLAYDQENYVETENIEIHTEDILPCRNINPTAEINPCNKNENQTSASKAGSVNRETSEESTTPTKQEKTTTDSKLKESVVLSNIIIEHGNNCPQAPELVVTETQRIYTRPKQKSTDSENKTSESDLIEKDDLEPNLLKLGAIDAKKTYTRCRQKSTDTENQLPVADANKRLLLSDQVPESPALVVNPVRTTYLKKDKLKAAPEQQQADEEKCIDMPEVNKKTLDSDSEAFSTPPLVIGQVRRTYSQFDDVISTPAQLIVGKVEKKYANRSRSIRLLSTEGEETSTTEKQAQKEQACDTVSSSSDVMNVRRRTPSFSSVDSELCLKNDDDLAAAEVRNVDITESTCSTSSNSKQLTSSSASADTPTRRVTRRSLSNVIQDAATAVASPKNILEVAKKIDGRRRKSASKVHSVEDPCENSDAETNKHELSTTKYTRSARSRSVDPLELLEYPGRVVIHDQDISQDKTDSKVHQSADVSSINLAKVKPRIRRTKSASDDMDDRKSVTFLPKFDLKDEVPKGGPSSVSSSKKGGRPRSRSLRAASISQLPAINEAEEEKRVGGVKSNNVGESYTSTRRLTRSQASMLKNVEGNISVAGDHDVTITPDLDQIDPIKLLDKSPFKGKPDPEEQKIYEQSSPSNSTVSSKPGRRKRRSVSFASDTSLPPSVTQVATPTKGRRKRASDSESSISLSLRSGRKRKSSVDDKSAFSAGSESPSPPKISRGREKYVDVGIEDSASVKSSSRSISKTSGAGSVSSVKSNKSTGSIHSATKRNTRKGKKGTELHDISEEKSSETTESSGKLTKERKTRNRKK